MKFYEFLLPLCIQWPGYAKQKLKDPNTCLKLKALSIHQNLKNSQCKSYSKSLTWVEFIDKLI